MAEIKLGSFVGADAFLKARFAAGSKSGGSARNADFSDGGGKSCVRSGSSKIFWLSAVLEREFPGRAEFARRWAKFASELQRD